MEAFKYPANRYVDERLWAPNHFMPYSAFSFTPYRPALPGPYVKNARQLYPACPCPVYNEGSSSSSGPVVAWAWAAPESD